MYLYDKSILTIKETTNTLLVFISHLKGHKIAIKDHDSKVLWLLSDEMSILKHILMYLPVILISFSSAFLSPQ